MWKMIPIIKEYAINEWMPIPALKSNERTERQCKKISDLKDNPNNEWQHHPQEQFALVFQIILYKYDIVEIERT